MFAEEKLNWVLNHTLDYEPDMTSRLHHGADPEFDRVLAMLGSVARQRPKPIIDALMIWRKSKSEPPEIMQTLGGRNGREPYPLILERNSLASIFILCRALIAVVGSLPRGALSQELGQKLEEMVFNQLIAIKP